MRKITFFVLFFVSFVGFSQEENQPSETKTKAYKDFPHYWVGLSYGVPLMFGDMYSVTERHFHWGHQGILRVGRQFSSIIGLEASLGYGWNKVSSPEFAYRFRLGSDGMTYYPYTLLNGVTYYTLYPGSPDLTGYQGNNTYNGMSIPYVNYDNAYSRVSFWQFGVQPTINLNRLFMAVPHDKEQRFTFLLKPAIYAQWFRSRAYNKTNDEAVSPKVNKINVALGGDLSLRYRFNQKWSAELYSGLTWVDNNSFDGVNTKRLSKDHFIWTTGLTLMYKFGHPLVEEETPKEIVPVSEEIPAPKPQIVFPNFAFSLEKPKAENQKLREVALESYLNFHLDKWFIDRGLANNETELRKIDSLFEKISQDTDVKLERISITGWASPEGEISHNYMLSRNRSKSLGDYISNKYGFTSIETQGDGEDWDGLLKTIENAENFPDKAKALSILKSQNDAMTKKAAMQSLPQYPFILEKYYPKSRRNISKFVFSVKPYTREEAQQIWQTSPEKLSLAEMWSVFEQETNEENLEKMLSVAEKVYPESIENHLNLAIMALKGNHLPKAEYHLGMVPVSEPKSWHLRAIFYAINQKTDFATFYFEKAVETNDENAQNNFKQYTEYLNKIKENENQ